MRNRGILNSKSLKTGVKNDDSEVKVKTKPVKEINKEDKIDMKKTKTSKEVKPKENIKVKNDKAVKVDESKAKANGKKQVK